MPPKKCYLCPFTGCNPCRCTRHVPGEGTGGRRRHTPQRGVTPRPDPPALSTVAGPHRFPSDSSPARPAAGSRIPERSRRARTVSRSTAAGPRGSSSRRCRAGRRRSRVARPFRNPAWRIRKRDRRRRSTGPAREVRVTGVRLDPRPPGGLAAVVAKPPRNRHVDGNGGRQRPPQAAEVLDGHGEQPAVEGADLDVRGHAGAAEPNQVRGQLVRALKAPQPRDRREHPPPRELGRGDRRYDGPAPREDLLEGNGVDQFVVSRFPERAQLAQ